MLAVAVGLAALAPARPVLVAVLLAPLWGVAATRMVVPRGMLLAVRTTFTGLVVPVGNRISGAARISPLGVAGAGTPPTLAIVSMGWPVPGKTDWGRAVIRRGLVTPTAERKVELEGRPNEKVLNVYYVPFYSP
jgi:hypothetical protein